mgnify:CR=1 FL=1
MKGSLSRVAAGMTLFHEFFRIRLNLPDLDTRLYRYVLIILSHLLVSVCDSG